MEDPGAVRPPSVHAPRSDYAVRFQPIEIGEHRLTIRSLLDRQQFGDVSGLAESRGISSASWSHFGQIWPSGLALAEHVDGLTLDGLRVLEVGCGLAIPGIVLHRRGADVVVSDHHPECQSFLSHNLRLNGLGPLPFRDVDWSKTNDDLGTFDVFIASDVLYERGHPRELAEFFERHARPQGRVLIIDPGRGEAAQFIRRMRESGFSRLDPPARPIARHRVIDFRRR